MKTLLFLLILLGSNSALATCVPLSRAAQPMWECEIEGGAVTIIISQMEDGFYQGMSSDGSIYRSRTATGNSWNLISAPTTPIINTADPTR